MSNDSSIMDDEMQINLPGGTEENHGRSSAGQDSDSTPSRYK